MLSQILDEYRKSGGAISLDRLSRKLGVERSALEGMLETLVRQGKLREAGASADPCGSCSSGGCHSCASHNIAANMGKSYELVD
jgi:hypothetical protein